MAKILVCKSDDLDNGKMVSITAGGKEILVIKTEDSLFGISNICPHAGAQLHEGDLKNKELTCPWHSAKWNIETGNLVWFPQKLKPLETFKVIEEDKRVYVEI